MQDPGSGPTDLNPPSLPPQTPAWNPPRRSLVVMLGLGLVIGSLAGGAIGGALVARTQKTVQIPASSNSTTVTTVVSSPPPGSLAAIYQQVVPGVVTIQTEVGSVVPRSFGEATGSGIVVDAQGDILTTAHVVANAQQLRVVFSDGHTAAATVSGVDNSDDLAIVHVSVSASELHPLTLGNSDAVQVGDAAMAIGTPFGLQGTLTTGIISGLNRSTTAPSGRALTGMIQTDAAINPGNSGGPLLNAAGVVIGIDESIQSPVQGSVGVGFAVPVNTAKRLLPQLEKGVAIQHPWLGISAQTITASTADSLGLTQRSGILVVAVVAGGPAAKAGLQASGQADTSDDIITAIDGTTLTSIEQLTSYLDTKHVGDHVTLSIVRGSSHLTVTATLADFQQQTTP